MPLGKTALMVSRLGLGTAPLGGLFAAVDEAQAVAVAERAYEHEMRLFDTAPRYGYGLAEHRLGRALAHKPRASFVLATKVGRLLRAEAPADESRYFHGEPLFKGTPDINPLRDYSYDGVMRSLEESLKRLGLDRVDIVYIHDPEQHLAEALRGAYPVLDRLRSEGTIKAVGVRMNQAEMLVRFAREEEVIERAVRLQSICHAHGVPLKAAAIPADLWQGLKAERLISEHAPVPGSRDAPHT
jgi:D-threo-aldose 1-dehydrogenase